jgi:thiazole/oxazole-forming peptide maturase SagD family component
VAERLARVGAAAVRAHLFDITSDVGITTVMCLLVSEQYPYAAVGAACRGDPTAACTKALDESVAVLASLRREAPAVLSTEHFEWVTTLRQHAQLYAGWRDTPAFDFLLDARAPAVPFDELASPARCRTPRSLEDVREVAVRLGRLGLTPLWADVTATEALALGHVVKVVVPEMLPLSPDHNANWLGAPRLARALGVTRARRSDVNPYPHPLA